MKERMKKLLACAGTVGALTIMLSVPVMADTKEDTQSIETQEVQEEAYDWSDKAAAAVNTYANIRSGADINNERVGKLPAGAVVTVEGEENGWMQVSSGDIKRRCERTFPIHTWRRRNRRGTASGNSGAGCCTAERICFSIRCRPCSYGSNHRV